LKIGAMATIRSVELSPHIRSNYAVLYEAIHQITSVQVKTVGTLVGNLCVATPASDTAVALFALGAELKIIGANGERVIPVEKFFIKPGKTVMKTGEIVTEVMLPEPVPGAYGAFMNMVRTAADIAKVNVAVIITVNGDTCLNAKIAVGAVAPTVFRAENAEGMIKGRKLDEEAIKMAAEAAAGETRPITDLRSTAEYRKEMTGILVGRALEKAVERGGAQSKGRESR
ncbi:FAD binding domain-containing protein, partial [Chloroflexota bacterium]